MPYDPPGFPTWPTGAPDYETTYKNVIPAQFPAGIYSDEGEAYADQQAFGIGFSQLRKMMWWLMEAFYPWLDTEGLLIDRWEEVFGLEPTGDLATRQRRVVASMRNRGTLTEDVIKAIWEWVFATTDPDDVTVVSPTPANTWAGSVNWRPIDWPFDYTLDTYHISGHGGAYVWGVGDAGMINLFTTSWTTSTSGTANNLRGVWAEPGNSMHAWAVGAGPTIREWNGATWGAGPAGGPANAIFGVSGSDRFYSVPDTEYQTRYMWTCGAGQEISRYDRSAAAWTNWTVGAGGDQWNKIHAVNVDDAWACSNNGKVAKWDGTSWTVWTVDAAEKWHGIRKMPDLKTYVVGTTGKCYWYSDEAGSWSAIATGTTETLNDLDGWHQERMIAVGTAGICLRYDGTSWNEIRTGTSKILRSVWISRQTVDAQIAGDDGATRKSPPNDQGFIDSQNSLHIYSTNQDLDPDVGLGDDKARLCEPAWGHFSYGRRRVARASDSDGASGCDHIVAG